MFFGCHGHVFLGNGVFWTFMNQKVSIEFCPTKDPAADLSYAFISCLDKRELFLWRPPSPIFSILFASGGSFLSPPLLMTRRRRLQKPNEN
jgi:hypothetical protein